MVSCYSSSEQGALWSGIDPESSSCRGTWGKTTSAYKLQAFMEATIGEDRLQTIQRDLQNFHLKRGIH